MSEVQNQLACQTVNEKVSACWWPLPPPPQSPPSDHSSSPRCQIKPQTTLTHSLTYSLLLWLTTLGLPRLCQDPPQLAQHRVLDGVLPGVLQLLGQHRVLLPAEPLPDLQGVGDRRLRGGQDLPHTPAQRRRVPPESGGHHRGGLPREGPGCGRRENQGTFFLFCFEERTSDLAGGLRQIMSTHQILNKLVGWRRGPIVSHWTLFCPPPK